jgi:hypothetical protein
MMKSLLLFLSFLILSSAYANEKTLLQCKATKIVDSSFLEEGLSVEEYPNVDISEDETGSKTMWLGSNLFKESNDDLIQARISIGFGPYYEITPSHTLEDYALLLRGIDDQKSRLYGRMRSNINQKFGDWSLLAELSCK